MSQAEDLLNSLDLETGEAGSGDKERHIVIGRDRYIIVPEELKKIAVQDDHDIETVTFDCPRYWDEHDMSTMKVYVNYIREDGYKDKKACSTPVVDEEDENIMHFDWTISRNATRVKGLLRFLVCIKKTDENGDEKNHWNSELNEDMYISEGLECDEIILSEQKDIITDILVRLEKAESVLDMSWVDATDKKFEDVEDGETIVGKAKADQHGNVIDEHYATKEENAEKFDKKGGVIDGDVEVTGALTTPGAVSEPEALEDASVYAVRETVKGQDIVDKSFAEVQLIEGATVKTKNLIPYPYYSSSGVSQGVAFTVNDDGSIKVSGTNDNVAQSKFTLVKNLVLPTGDYYISGNNVEVAIRYANNTYSYRKGGSSFALNDGAVISEIYIVVEKGSSADITTYPMLNEGTTALPYTPYFSGLKHAFINSIKSTGRNLLNLPEDLTFTGVRILSNVKLRGGNYTCSIESYEKGGSDAPVVLFNKVGGNGTEEAFYANYMTLPFKLTGGVYNIYFYSNGWSYPNSDGVTSTLRSFMLNYGNKPLPYEPYTEDIYQLPETVELAGLDMIDVAARKKITRVKTITLTGEENWQAGVTNTEGVYRCGLYVADNYFDANEKTVISNYYDSAINSDVYGGSKGVASANNYLYIFDPDFSTSDISLWKAHLAELYAAGKPLIIEYQLKEPVESSIDVPNGYITYDKGSETIVQGDDDNSQFGAMPTVTTKYAAMENPKETATKEFVLNALTKKIGKNEVAEKAKEAEHAKEATYANTAGTASFANSAASALNAGNATYDTQGRKIVETYATKNELITGATIVAKSTFADRATNADNAQHATDADSAGYADDATHALDADRAKVAETAENIDNALAVNNIEVGVSSSYAVENRRRAKVVVTDTGEVANPAGAHRLLFSNDGDSGVEYGLTSAQRSEIMGMGSAVDRVLYCGSSSAVAYNTTGKGIHVDAPVDSDFYKPGEVIEIEWLLKNEKAKVADTAKIADNAKAVNNIETAVEDGLVVNHRSASVTLTEVVDPVLGEPYKDPTGFYGSEARKTVKLEGVSRSRVNEIMNHGESFSYNGTTIPSRESGKIVDLFDFEGALYIRFNSGTLKVDDIESYLQNRFSDNAFYNAIGQTIDVEWTIPSYKSQNADLAEEAKRLQDGWILQDDSDPSSGIHYFSVPSGRAEFKAKWTSPESGEVRSVIFGVADFETDDVGHLVVVPLLPPVIDFENMRILEAKISTYDIDSSKMRVYVYERKLEYIEGAPSFDHAFANEEQIPKDEITIYYRLV